MCALTLFAFLSTFTRETEVEKFLLTVNKFMKRADEQARIGSALRERNAWKMHFHLQFIFIDGDHNIFLFLTKANSLLMYQRNRRM